MKLLGDINYNLIIPLYSIIKITLALNLNNLFILVYVIIWQILSFIIAIVLQLIWNKIFKIDIRSRTGLMFVSSLSATVAFGI